MYSSRMKVNLCCWLLVFFLGISFLSFASPPDSIWLEGFEEPAKEGGTLHATTLAGEFQMLPPNKLLARTLKWPIYEPIIQIHWDGTKFVPAVAESWEVSEDNTKFTFHLREGAMWHDGHPVDSGDVIFTYHAILHPKFPVVGLQELETIKGYEAYASGECDSLAGLSAPDERTVVMEVNSPYAEFLQGPAKALLLPEHILGDIPMADLAGADFWKKPVGIGPFKFVSRRAGEFVVTERFEDYYRGTPKMAEVVLMQIPEESTETRVSSLLDGSLDIADHHWQLTQAQKDRIDKDPDLLFLSHPGNLVRGFTFKETKEYLTPEVRRALMTAINSEELINAVVGYGEPIQTFVPSAVSPNLDRWSYDLEKAKEMLEEAGWDFDRKLQLVTYYGTDRFRNILQAIASYWDRIGVKADVTLVGDFSTFNERWGSTDWGDICFCGIGARGLAWSTIDHYIHSERTYSKGFNAGYASDKADELIEKLRETADQDERIELLYELEEVVHEDVALGPIWAVMETRVINKRLNNYKFNVVANMPAYFGTYLWWIEE